MASSIIPFQYLYLTLALIEFGAALIIFAKRPDLRMPIVTAGFFGGILEVVSEFWYLKDYWKPLSIIPGWPAPEDFLYGFGVTALTVCVVPILFSRKYERRNTSVDSRLPWVRGGNVFGMCVYAIGFAAYMTFGPKFMGDTPSIWLAFIAFASLGMGLLLANWRNIGSGLLTAAVMGLMALVGYAIGLNFVVDGDAFLRQVWLLYDTPWNARVLGNVPADEVMWNTARAWCISLIYLEVTSQRFAPLNSKK